MDKAVADEIIQDTLSHYGLGGLLRTQRMPKGYSNANFKLETTKGTYLLRVCRSQDELAIRHEIRLMARLQEADFPIAHPVADGEGVYARRHGEDTAMLYPFLEGTEPEMTPDTVAVIARANARLHLIPPVVDPLRENPMTLDFCKGMIANFDKKIKEYEDVYAYFERKTADLAEALSFRRQLPQGLIHADMFTDNTLFKDGELVAVLDFEDACSDALLVDIGTTINGFCCPNNRLDWGLVDVFIKNYQKIRPLTDKEQELLPLYIQWGAHAMIAWHFHYVLQERNERKLHRVRELMERVGEMGSSKE